MLQSYDERNADIVYWVNGVLRHRDEPGLSPFDSVVQGGDAVWEGLRLYDGRIFGLDAHLARLHRSALALGFTAIPSRDEMVAALIATLHANGMRDGVHVRLTLTRGVKVTSGMDPRLNTAGSTLVVLAEHKPPVYGTGGLRLVTASVRRPGPDVLDPRIHHTNLLNSILAKIEANNAGADDALMLDTRGFVAETNATNIFIVRAGKVETSHILACPAGITRATVIETCAAEKIRCIETDLSLVDVYGADEMFCTGTMGELAGIIKIDNRIIGNGNIGPMTKRLSELYVQRTATEGVQVV